MKRIIAAASVAVMLMVTSVASAAKEPNYPGGGAKNYPAPPCKLSGPCMA